MRVLTTPRAHTTVLAFHPTTIQILCKLLFLVMFSRASFLAPQTKFSYDRPRTCSTFLVSPSRSETKNSVTTSVSQKKIVTPLQLFGFGGDDTKPNKKDKELARYSELKNYDDLSRYIQKWSEQFESDPKKMKLTTPVQVLPSEDGTDEEEVVDFSGIRIVFQKTKTGNAYLSSAEEKALEQDDDDEDDAEGDARPKSIRKEGGVEVLVLKFKGGEVQVRARRCDMDEDTMIKEMSEERIIQELKKAINLWKKMDK